MSDIDKAYARFVRQQRYFWAASIYCFAAVAAIAASAVLGRLPGHDLDQISPLLLHLALNGSIIAIFTWSRKSVSLLANSITVQIGSLLLGFGIGLVDLDLAISAALALTPANAPALLLIAPGIAMLLPMLPTFSRGPGPSAEVLEEPPRVPTSELAPVYAGVIADWILLIFTLSVAYELARPWYAVLKSVLWTATRYRFSDALHPDLLRNLEWRPAALLVAVFILLLVCYAVFMLARNQLRRRLSEGQRELVQSRLRALWEYANAPEQPSRSVATVLLPLIPWLVVFVASLALLGNIDKFVQWLA